MNAAIKGYELDPLPDLDFHVGRHDMLHIPASGELHDLGLRGDFQVRVRAGLLYDLGSLRLDSTPHDREE